MASGCLLVCSHGLRGVHPGEGVAEGHHGFLAEWAAGGDNLHVSTGALQTITGSLLLETTMEEAF